MTIESPALRDVEFRHESRNWGVELHVLAVYRTNGPTFRGAAWTDTRDWLPSERHRMLAQLERDAFSVLRAQVGAHRAVVLPIFND